MNKKNLIPVSYKSWLVILLIWLLIGFYFILSSAVYYLNLEREFKWIPNLVDRMPSYLMWGLLAPFIIYLALRFRIEKPKFFSKLILQLFIGALVAFIHRILSVSVSYFIFNIYDQSKKSLTELLFSQKFIIFSYWFDGFFTYWFFLAAIYSFDYYKSFNENKIKATELEAKLAQAELNALKMQLQPHFLFNTLNAISVLVHKDPESADEMITKLSDLLRLTLDKFGQKRVTLKEEIEFINSYLEIQKIRYKERLLLEINIPAELMDAEVPALILQPVVENSIKYAVEPSSKQTKISISSLKDNGNLIIEVEDNGPGLYGSFREGVGIKNIKSRLSNMYGKKFTFEVSDSPGTGVKTIIKIPVEI